jgi:hypothetical protein
MLSEGQASEEDELKQALQVLASRRALPATAELEPGAFLHLVKTAWATAAGRDGRRGHLSEGRLATLIEDRIARTFTRNQYQAMFGEGRKLGGVERYSQPVPRDVAEAFLTIALQLWRRPPPSVIGVDFLPLLDPREWSLETIIRNACDVMYGRDGKERTVYCRESRGRGGFSVYKDSGAWRRSLLLATPHDPIVITDPERNLIEWLELMESLLLPRRVEPAASKRPLPLHIWAFREPAMMRDGRSAAYIYSLGRLRSVLLFARGLALSNLEGPEEQGGARDLWDAVASRGVIAIRRRNALVPDNPTIHEDLVFPETVPAAWREDGGPRKIEQLMAIASIERDDRVDYYATDIASSPPAIRFVGSPGVATDHSFLALYRACRAFATSPSPKTDPLVTQAAGEGWELLTPEAFLKTLFPLDATARR